MNVYWAEIIYISADYIPAYMFDAVAHVSSDFHAAISRYTMDGEMLIVRSSCKDGEPLFFNGLRKYRNMTGGVCPMTRKEYKVIDCDVVAKVSGEDMAVTFNRDKAVAIASLTNIFSWAGYGEVINGDHINIQVGDMWKITSIDGVERQITVGGEPKHIDKFLSHEQYLCRGNTKGIFMAYGQIYVVGQSVREGATPTFRRFGESVDDVNKHFWDVSDIVDVIYPIRSNVIKSWVKK